MEGFVYYTAAREAARQAVNSWLRSANEFDALLDWDLSLRDPAAPGIEHGVGVVRLDDPGGSESERREEAGSPGKIRCVHEGSDAEHQLSSR